MKDIVSDIETFLKEKMKEKHLLNTILEFCNYKELKIIEDNNEDWHKISKYGILKPHREYDKQVINGLLSEDFITSYSDKLDWFEICACQKLSKKYIVKFKNKTYNYAALFLNLSPYRYDYEESFISQLSYIMHCGGYDNCGLRYNKLIMDDPSYILTCKMKRWTP